MQKKKLQQHFFNFFSVICIVIFTLLGSFSSNIVVHAQEESAVVCNDPDDPDCPIIEGNKPTPSQAPTSNAPTNTTSNSIAGDGLCGASSSTACGFEHVQIIVKKVVAIVIGLGLPFLIMILGYRIVMAWFAAREGNAGAYKEAIKKAGHAIIGFLVIVIVVGGGLVVLLQYIGASDNFLKILRLLSEGLISAAHAQERLPSPLKEDIDLYGFMLNFFGLVMRFFVYPALIVIWVWTGFGFVMAQGKPEALAKAKTLLVWATVSTLILVLMQAFLFAARGTVEQILPGSTTDNNPQSATINQESTDCSRAGGVLSTDGRCVTPSRAGSAANDYCNGKPTGTLCSVYKQNGYVTGICKKDNATFGCFIPSAGESCITANNSKGVIDSSGRECVTGRTLIGPGGSCQFGDQCSSGKCLPTSLCE